MLDIKRELNNLVKDTVLLPEAGRKVMTESLNFTAPLSVGSCVGYTD